MKTIQAPETEQISDWLKARVPLFAELSVEELSALARITRCAEFQAQETIVRQGMTLDDLHLIVSGTATVRVRSSPGHWREPARLGPGDLFGETSIIEHGTASASVRAEEALTVYLIGQEELLRVMDRNPRFKERLQALVLARRSQSAKPSAAAA